MAKRLLILSLSLTIFNVQFLFGQCSCTDCPVNTVSNGTVNSVLNISGAANPTLGAGGQGLAEICIDYFTDAVNEVNMTLTAPDGSSVLLMQQTGISVNSNLDFQICFIPCGCPSEPDPGFSSIFDSDENWVAGPTYSGTYYPSVGCFENLSGPVDGNWTITIQDVIALDNGTLNDWTISFLDNAGLPCVAQTSCVPFICSADGGVISEPSLSYCQGDAALDFNLAPTYPNGTPPDPIEYGYTYIISDAASGVILEYSDDPDLTMYAPGSYEICGLSYFLSHYSSIPQPNGSYSIGDLLNDIIDEVFCASIASGCFTVVVLNGEEVVLIGPSTVCTGELYSYTIENYFPENEYTFTTNIGATQVADITVNEPNLDIIWSSGSGMSEICIEAESSCGTFTDCIDITVLETPTIEIFGDDPVCNNDPVIYIIQPALEIGESWLINLTAGAVVGQSDNSISIIWDVTGSPSGQLCVNIEGATCNITEVCQDVTFSPVTPPEDFTFPENLCLGDSDISFVNPDENITNYLWILNNLVEISGNGTPAIQYTTDQAGIATICLEMTTACNDVHIICNDIIVSETLEVDILSEEKICGLVFDLFALVDPLAELTWTQISNPNTAFIAQTNSAITTVITESPGIYEFSLTATLGACTTIETITVETSDEMEISNIEEICIDGVNYTVEFDISGGIQPYSVNGTEISGTHFISTSFASGESYSFTVSDEGVCELEINASFSCDCVNQSGTVDTELLEACAQIGSQVSVGFNGGEILEDDDTFVFILHDNSNSQIGDIIEINQTGIFEYNSSIIPNVEYYISHVTGNGIDIDVDLQDPCLDVSIGQPVIFYSLPMADSIDSIVSCDNTLFFEFQNLINTDEIEWNLIAGPGIVDIAVFDLETIFEFENSGQFIFEYVLINEHCESNGLLEIYISDSIQLINATHICQSNGENYDLIIELEGGISPLSLEGEGILVGTEIFAENLVDTIIYEFIITDSLNCSQIFTFGPVQCDCDKDLGTINDQAIFICEGEEWDPTIISNLDFNFESTIDSFAFYIYEDSNAAIEDYIAINWGTSISQLPLFNLNQDYFIRLIVGIYDENTNSIDLEDNCLQVSQVITFQWIADYEFLTDIHPTVCSSDNFYTWTQDFPGPFPYTVTFSSVQGPDVIITVNNAEEIVMLPIYPGATDWEITDASVPCGFTFFGNLTITALDELVIELIPFDTICNTSIGGSTIILADLLENPLDGEWFYNGNPINEEFIDFEDSIVGQNEITFSTVGFADACPGTSESFSFFIQECLCDSLIVEDFFFCNDGDPITSFDLFPVGGMAEDGFFMTFENPNNLPNPINLDGININLQEFSPGYYDLVYTLNGEIDSFCPSQFTSSFYLEEKNIAGEAQVDINFCDEEINNINLDEYIDNQNPIGTWYFNDNPSSNNINNDNLLLGTNEFIYITEAGEYCNADSAILNIDKIPLPDASVNAMDVLCFGDINGSIEIQIVSDDFGPYSCFINGDSNDSKLIENLPPGNYEINIINDFGCNTTIENILIDEPEIVSVNLGEDLNVIFNDELTIEALVNILQSDIVDINWTDLSGQLDSDDLILIQNAIANNTIQITITDDNGCIAIDEINIRLIEQDILLANIISLNSSIPENKEFGIPAISTIINVNSFLIYDRWGEKVYDQKNILPGSEEAYWDGTFKGQQAIQGVYAYYISYEDVFGNTKVIIGDVTLIK